MRINSIHLYRALLPVKGGDYRMAGGTVRNLDSTLVEVVTEDGLTGWGETCPIGPVYQPHHTLGARAAIAEIAPGLIGEPTQSVRHLARRMDERLNGHNYAKAAFDIAFLDVIGQRLGVPVSTLLGGALTDRVPSYYSTIVGAPDNTARIAAEKVGQGYPRLQIKIGGISLEQDIETVHKVWEAVGFKARMAVDGNRGLTVASALQLDQLCRSIPFVFEQPCHIHWSRLAAFAEMFRRPRIRDSLFVKDGQYSTCAGELAAFDLAVDLIGSHGGEFIAHEVCRYATVAGQRPGSNRQSGPSGLAFTADCDHLVAAMRIMEENLEFPLSMDDVAGRVGISGRHLERLFASHVGVPPLRHYLKLRVEQARRLIKGSRMPIIDIAVACGFTSHSHFSKCFRNVFGMSPQECRSSVPAWVGPGLG